MTIKEFCEKEIVQIEKLLSENNERRKDIYWNGMNYSKEFLEGMHLAYVCIIKSYF
jgi:hypothetical protein